MRLFGCKIHWLLGLGCWLVVGNAFSEELLLKDGRVLKGKLGQVASLAEKPQPPDPDGMGPIRSILFVDDDLRRTFVSTRQRQPVPVRRDSPGEVEERFNIPQREARSGRMVQSVGPVLKITPFDEFGRRTFIFNTPRGEVAVVQGITLLTPTWAKVEGLKYVWDMRIATSSIPRDVLHRILMKQIDPTKVEHHKKIARFYLQSERYSEARAALEAIPKLFPENPELEESLAPTIRRLRQLGAGRLLAELKLRRTAGQHKMVYEKLKAFPSEDVAGEILQAVREMVQQYDGLMAQGKGIGEQFDALFELIEEEDVREKIEPIGKEIRAELNVNTLSRMAAFRQSVDDPDMLPQEKLALAISGWLLGSDAAIENMAVARSVYRVRGLVRQYLNEPVKLNRNRIFGYFQSEEGATPKLVAALLAHMKPARELPEPIAEDKPGYYELEIPGLLLQGLAEQLSIQYLVQLPPEYDPYRKYPAIVTLRGVGTTAEQQIDWWAGDWADGGWRRGQATRHGYIVIAPRWTAEHQKKYGYSAREHAAVLNSLRDACRRFSVDTDRVFLSGHSMGGDAAWDLGLAHPDLWAGVIPIVARSDRYCSLYWENAKRLPFYVVLGEKDGAMMAKNSRDLDRYLKRGYNCTVVEYRGRGHEHFHEEILRLFDWTGRFRRNFFPREFTCSTMREWDNYFWWIELQGMPPKSMVDPVNWPPKRGTLPVQVKAKLLNTNGINIRTGTSRVSVWVSPEMLDFDLRANVVVNGRRLNSRDPFIQPDLLTLLEDVRTRGDRQHPFWAKVDTQSGR